MLDASSFGDPDEPSADQEQHMAVLGIDSWINTPAEAELEQQIRAGGFAIALSGGGHRATLAATGALLAISDRKLAGRVLQISSVSGGSIANAAVACEGKYTTKGVGEFDDLARSVVDMIVRRGVLGLKAIIGLVVLGLTAAIVAGTLVGWQFHSYVAGVFLTIFIAFGLHLLSGHLVDRRLKRCLDSISSGTDSPTVRTIAEVPESPIDHVFCTTDLVLGLPLYFSTSCGGAVWRRLAQGPEATGLPQVQTFGNGNMPIARVIRASAGFPGIPPVSISIPRDPGNYLVGVLPKKAYLADGGQWNNLGTQALREDRFLGSQMDLDAENVPRPRFPAIEPYVSSVQRVPVLVVDGSGSLAATGTLRFKIPVVAQAAALVRLLRILNTNTVWPRIESIQAAALRRSTTLHRTTLRHPFEVVVDLEPVRRTAARVAKMCATDDDRHQLGTSLPWGIPSYEDWLRIHSDALGAVRDEEDPNSAGQLKTRTTLGRISHAETRQILARAYLNTMLASLALSPLTDSDCEAILSLPQRLNSIVNAHPSS